MMNLLKADEVARRLNVSKNTAYRLMREMGVIDLNRGAGKPCLRVQENRLSAWLDGCIAKPHRRAAKSPEHIRTGLDAAGHLLRR